MLAIYRYPQGGNSARRTRSYRPYPYSNRYHHRRRTQSWRYTRMDEKLGQSSTPTPKEERRQSSSRYLRLNRLPTLQEVLDRRTRPPLDLFCFYVRAYYLSWACWRVGGGLCGGLVEYRGWQSNREGRTMQCRCPGSKLMSRSSCNANQQKMHWTFGWTCNSMKTCARHISRFVLLTPRNLTITDTTPLPYFVSFGEQPNK